MDNHGRVQYIDPVSLATYPLQVPRWCSAEGRPLMIEDLSGIGRDDIDKAKRSLWRYRAALPIEIRAPISMGEGQTPLLEKVYGGASLRFKLEWFAPTGSFKDRGASVMLSYLAQFGVHSILEDSSGNGGAAIAAYAAAGGLRAKILAPSTTQSAKLAQMRAFGAEVQLVPGPRDACQTEAIRQSAQIFYASHAWQPFFLQGTKTLAYELWEDLSFTVPDNVIIPVGGGSNVLGCDIGFSELLATGQIRTLPKLFCAQPANCAPIHARFTAASDHEIDVAVAPTFAEGASIRHPVRIREVLAALRRSGGSTIAITEEEIVAAVRKLGAIGLFAEPTSALAAAAAERLLAHGVIRPTETTVVVLTGSGLKASGVMVDLFNPVNRPQ